MPERVASSHQQRPILLSLRQPVRNPAHRSQRIRPQPFSDIVVARPQTKAKITSQTLRRRVDDIPAPVFDVIQPAPFVKPAAKRQQTSKVLQRQVVRRPTAVSTPQLAAAQTKMPKEYSRLQVVLVSMACLVFGIGLFASVQTLLTNHTASAQVAALSKKVDAQAGSGSSSQTDTAVPSITKPSAQDIANYSVAPDMPRYLNIPSLKVHARIMQVSAQKNGALGVPWDIFDSGWYTGSAKPGQPGATLIDGHVAAWTTHGVFYGIHTLQAGDTIQVVRGDGVTINYQVVKTQSYPANHVDMKAALRPVTPGISGLNLITCAGTAAAGTNNYNQRVIVFAQEVN